MDTFLVAFASEPFSTYEVASPSGWFASGSWLISVTETFGGQMVDENPSS